MLNCSCNSVGQSIRLLSEKSLVQVQPGAQIGGKRVREHALTTRADRASSKDWKAGWPPQVHETGGCPSPTLASQVRLLTRQLSQATSHSASPDRETRSGRTDASPEHLQLNTVPVEVHDFYCEASAMPNSNTVLS
jgi:hypothetical protein